ncbi:MAG: hypothetical protein WC718_17600 [Phycisphaerales bacterium]|jgi:hypothetical protein
MHETFNGYPFVAFDWPTDAPPPFDRPEAALKEWWWFGTTVRLISVPVFGSWMWTVHVMLSNHEGSTRVDIADLRPMEELRCGWDGFNRRHGQRRKGERRAVRSNNDWYGGRRNPCERRERRTGKDRRKP